MLFLFFFLMFLRPPIFTQSRSSAASDVYKRQLKQAMKGLDSFLTTHYSFRYNQITEQCEFHDKHKFDKYRVVDEREFNTLVINAIEEGAVSYTHLTLPTIYSV